MVTRNGWNCFYYIEPTLKGEEELIYKSAVNKDMLFIQRIAHLGLEKSKRSKRARTIVCHCKVFIYIYVVCLLSSTEVLINIVFSFQLFIQSLSGLSTYPTVYAPQLTSSYTADKIQTVKE
jgi:hypothetical protein